MKKLRHFKHFLFYKNQNRKNTAAQKLFSYLLHQLKTGGMWKVK